MGRRVRLLLEPGGRLRVYDGGELVATHDTAAPGGPIVYREGDYAEAMADGSVNSLSHFRQPGSRPSSRS